MVQDSKSSQNSSTCQFQQVFANSNMDKQEINGHKNDLLEQQEEKTLEGEDEQEDEVEMLETMNMMTFVSMQIQKENDQKRAEEEEMNQALQILNQVLLSENDRRMARGEFDDLQRQVRFCTKVKVAYLPLEECKEARQARKRFWGSGPLHDELWDGDSNAFRETELTPEQLVVIHRRKTKVDKLRTLFRLKDAKIDVRAHAKRSITDEAEEEDSDEFEKDDDVITSISISTKNSNDQLENKSKIEKRRSTLKLVTSYIRSSVNPSNKSKMAKRGSKENTSFHPILVLNECAPLKGEWENANQYQNDELDQIDDQLQQHQVDTGVKLWVVNPHVQGQSQ